MDRVIHMPTVWDLSADEAEQVLGEAELQFGTNMRSQ